MAGQRFVVDLALLLETFALRAPALARLHPTRACMLIESAERPHERHHRRTEKEREEKHGADQQDADSCLHSESGQTPHRTSVEHASRVGQDRADSRLEARGQAHR
jgi:hypothetical protein